MNKLLLFFQKVVLYVALLVFYTVVASASFDVMTWNILGPKAMDVEAFFPGINQNNRMKNISAAINLMSSDIVCLQETSEQTCDVLATALHADYDRAGVARKGKDGGCSIFYKKSSFDHMLSQEFDLDTSGAAFCCLFEQCGKKNHVLICCVHIGRANEKIVGRVDGERQLRILCRNIASFFFKKHGVNPDIPIIITGDFNTLYSEARSETLSFLQSELHKSNLKMYWHNSWTANHASLSSKKLPKHVSCDGKYSSIDHVFFDGLRFSKGLVGDGLFKDISVSTTVQFQDGKNRFPKIQNYVHSLGFRNWSDHLPIQVTFQFDRIVPLCTSHAHVKKTAVSLHQKKHITPKGKGGKGLKK